MKKLISLIIAVVLVLAMTVPAMAVEPVSANLTDHTYKAYQIFTGTQDATGKLGNIVWGNGIDSTAFLAALQAADAAYTDCTTAADVAAILSTKADKSDDAKAFAALAYDYITTGVGVEKGVNPTTPGYYLVVDETPASGDNFVTNIALLQLTGKGTFDIENKVDVPEVDKKILDDEPVEVNEASVGEVVKYQITGTLPSNLADYETYYYQFVDTLSAGLTFNNNVVIMMGETNVTGNFTIAHNNGNITITCANVKAIAGVTVNSTFVVTYSATLNENAVIAGEGNPNNVHLVYSNNPNKSEGGTPGTPDHPTGKTPDKEVKTYVTELDLFKYTGENTPLAGAKFRLTGNGVILTKVNGTKYVASDSQLAEGETLVDNLTYYELKNGAFTTTEPKLGNEDAYQSTTATFKWVAYEEWVTKSTTVAVEAFVGANGHLIFTGLGAGTYTLTEVVTPAGYNSIGDIEFTITFDKDTKTFASENNLVYVGDGDNKLDTRVLNNSGSILPETGGIGTTIFYVLGSILLVGAAVLLITKKRMGSHE